MKYLIIKTDIQIQGCIYSEGSIIDSENISKEDLESLSHFLVSDENSNSILPLADTDVQNKVKKTESVAALKKSKRSIKQ